MPKLANPRDAVQRLQDQQRRTRELEVRSFGKIPQYEVNSDHPHPIAEWLAYPGETWGFSMGEASSRLWAAENSETDREILRLIRVARLRSGATKFWGQYVDGLPAIPTGNSFGVSDFLKDTGFEGYLSQIGGGVKYDNVGPSFPDPFSYLLNIPKAAFDEVVVGPVPPLAGFHANSSYSDTYGFKLYGLQKMGRGQPMRHPARQYSQVTGFVMWQPIAQGVVQGAWTCPKPGFTLGWGPVRYRGYGRGTSLGWPGYNYAPSYPLGYEIQALPFEKTPVYMPQAMPQGGWEPSDEPLPTLMGPGDWSSIYESRGKNNLQTFLRGDLDPNSGKPVSVIYLPEEDLKVYKPPTIRGFQREGSDIPNASEVWYGANYTDPGTGQPQTWAGVVSSYQSVMDSSDLGPLRAWAAEHLRETIDVYDHGWVAASSVSLMFNDEDPNSLNGAWKQTPVTARLVQCKCTATGMHFRGHVPMQSMYNTRPFTTATWTGMPTRATGTNANYASASTPCVAAKSSTGRPPNQWKWYTETEVTASVTYYANGTIQLGLASGMLLDGLFIPWEQNA